MYKGINSYSRSRNKKQKNSRVYFLNKNKTRSEFMKGGEKKSHVKVQYSPLVDTSFHLQRLSLLFTQTKLVW